MGFRRSLALLVIGTLAPLLVSPPSPSISTIHQRNRRAEQTLLDASARAGRALDRIRADTALTDAARRSTWTAVIWRVSPQCARALAGSRRVAAIGLFDASGRRPPDHRRALGSARPGGRRVMTEPFGRLSKAADERVDLFESPLTGGTP